jgi:UDP-glucose:(heptosyl)LPS alpha-1,3-glucosyltransferase
MKIALVHRRFTTQGGTERYLVHLARYLVHAGHEIHVFCNEVRDDLIKEFSEVTFHHLPMIKVGRAMKVLTLAVSASRRIRSGAFDIVQGFGRTLRQDVMRAGGGCHRVYYDRRMAEAGWPERLLLRFSMHHRLTLWIERYQYRPAHCRRVIAVSQRVRCELIQSLGVDPDRVEVVYNGVDLERFRPDDAVRRITVRKRHGIPEESDVVLFLGTGFRRKGLETVFRAFARGTGSDRFLMVVGGDATEEYYRRLARSLGIGEKVVFCGPTREPEAYYSAADLFVFPTRYEPFGNVCVEAMASGLPVITTEINGASEVFPEEARELVLQDPEDVKGLADRMEGLLSNRERMKAVGAKCRIAAEALNWEANGRRVEAIYRELVAEGGGSTA